MKTQKHIVMAGIWAVFAIALLALAACESPADPPPEPVIIGDSQLSGTISISPGTGVTINTVLTANYSGTETVSYQWEKDGSNVGTNSNKYTPTAMGSYTVTVSATGYESKTSAAVTVSDGNSGGGGTTVPSAPTGVTATRNPAGSTTVTVSWNAVSGATSYRVYYSSTGSGSGDYLEGSPSTTSFNSSDNSTTGTHYFRVSAVNSAGEGSPSSWVIVGPVSGSGGTTVPSAPTGVTLTTLSTGDVQISWNAVSGATGYRVQWAVSAAGPWGFLYGTNTFPVEGTSITSSVPSPGEFVRVIAVNSAGDGNPSASVVVPVASSGGGGTTVPSAPTGVTAARNQANPTYVTISWNVVNGATSYKVYYSETGSDSGFQVGSSSVTSFESFSYTTTETYYFRVSAVNNAGEGSPSSWVMVGPVSGGGGTTVPSAPTGVTATRNPAGSTTVTVSWNAVSGATSYRVYWSDTNSGSGSLEGSPSTTSFNSTGNTTTGTHYFRVSAVNSAGEGTPSSWVSVGPVSGGSGTTPGTPTSVSASAQSSSSIRISWSAPSSGGTPTYYNIWRSSSASGTYTEIGWVIGSTLSYTDTGLNASTTYYYKVDAENSEGRSSQSSYTSATTSSSSSGGGTAPSAPSITNITVISSGTAGLRITWGSVTGATSYKVYRSNSQYGTYTLLATKGSELAHDDTTVNLNSAGTSYYYQIAGVNSAGSEGSKSDGKGVTLPSGVTVNFTIPGRTLESTDTSNTGQPRVYHYRYFTGWYVTIGSTEYYATYARRTGAVTSQDFVIPPGTYSTFQTKYRYQNVQVAGPGHASAEGTEISAGTNTTISYVNRPTLTLDLLSKYTIAVNTGTVTKTAVTLVMK